MRAYEGLQRRVVTMKKDTKKHDWRKAQPHHVVTGKITTEAYARNHPEKVEWERVKTGRRGK